MDWTEKTSAIMNDTYTFNEFLKLYLGPKYNNSTSNVEVEHTEVFVEAYAAWHSKTYPEEWPND